LIIEFELKVSSHIGCKIPKTVHVFFEFSIQQVIHLYAHTEIMFEKLYFFGKAQVYQGVTGRRRGKVKIRFSTLLSD
jgi:hypothetical protein